MINFASLFGTFNRGNNSAISDLLEKRSTTLEQLLDIDSFPNEYKSGNSKVIEYMNYSKFQELVSYVTVEGPVDNQKKGYKFPMVAADILSSENNTAIQFFLPEADIQIDVQYKETQEIDVEVNDDDQNYLTEEEHPKKDNQQEETSKNQSQPTTETTDTKNQTQVNEPQKNKTGKTESEEPAKPVVKSKKKIIKEKKVVTKIRKEKRDPLIAQLLVYYEGPINYTLAGYNCKVLSLLFTKKPTQFLNYIFFSEKNYIQLICNHIESKSVGDLLTKILVWENVEFVEERKKLYDHLIRLMSEIKQSHAISNLSSTISQIIEKTSIYIKSKQNIANNQQIIKAFLLIFYRTSEVHKIVDNAISEDENVSGYNCMVLHSYLHHTQIETFNSFKLEQVLESFIKKASEKLRRIQNRATLGMGRIKIIEIFSFLIRKQPKAIDDQNRNKNQMSSQLLQQLYNHTIIANQTDFFSILIKLVQSFENNNILHNEFFKIIQLILKEPQQNKSALQQLLLNDENFLLKFIVAQKQKDSLLKLTQKHSKRKGYIGHVINICKLIDQIDNNQLLNQKIKKTLEFQEVLDTMIAIDITETNKSLAGYQIKKNPTHDIMFQKQDILTAYADFLARCPKPQFEPQQPQSSEQQTQQTAKIEQEKQSKKAEQTVVEKQLQQQKRDEQKFNQVAMSEQVDASNPKYWITHMKFDVDQLMMDEKL